MLPEMINFNTLLSINKNTVHVVHIYMRYDTYIVVHNNLKY